MADLTPNTNGDSGDGTGTPRWVKVFGIFVVALVLLVVVMMFIGRNHGPGRHMPSKEQEVQQP